MKRLNIYKKLKKIGFRAFYHSSLNQIKVLENDRGIIRECNVYYDRSSEKLLMSGSKSGFWFYPCGIKEIGEYAFAGFEDSIYLPYSVKKIGAYAFRESTLEKFTIPPKVKIINEGTFAYCKNLSSVEMAANVQKIHMNAFVGCEKLNEIIVHKDKMYIQINGIANSLMEYVNELYDEVLTLDKFIWLLLNKRRNA